MSVCYGLSESNTANICLTICEMLRKGFGTASNVYGQKQSVFPGKDKSEIFPRQFGEYESQYAKCKTE